MECTKIVTGSRRYFYTKKNTVLWMKGIKELVKGASAARIVQTSIWNTQRRAICSVKKGLQAMVKCYKTRIYRGLAGKTGERELYGL